MKTECNCCYNDCAMEKDSIPFKCHKKIRPESNSEQPMNEHGFLVCTRAAGHSGLHCACSDEEHALAEWDGKEEVGWVK